MYQIVSLCLWPPLHTANEAPGIRFFASISSKVWAARKAKRQSLIYTQTPLLNNGFLQESSFPSFNPSFSSRSLGGFLFSAQWKRSFDSHSHLIRPRRRRRRRRRSPLISASSAAAAAADRCCCRSIIIIIGSSSSYIKLESRPIRARQKPSLITGSFAAASNIMDLLHNIIGPLNRTTFDVLTLWLLNLLALYKTTLYNNHRA